MYNPSTPSFEIKPVNAAKSEETESRQSNVQTASLKQVSTMKDAKLAEIQGENITFGEEQMIKAIEKANKALQGASTSFEFSIHEKTKEIMVKVLNKETGEIIREIPPEKTLDMIAKMWELAGLMIDKKA